MIEKLRARIRRKYPDPFSRVFEAVQLLRPFSETTVHFDRWNYKETYIDVGFGNRDEAAEWALFVKTFRPNVKRTESDTYRDWTGKEVPSYFYHAETEICGIKVGGYSPLFKKDGTEKDTPSEAPDEKDAAASYMVMKFVAGVADNMAEKERQKALEAEKNK